MHVQLGDYHISDMEFVAAFDVDKEKVGKDLVRGDLLGPEQHLQVHGRPAHGREGRARHDPRRHRQVPVPGDQEGPRPDGRCRRDPEGARGRRHGLLPAGRQRGRHQVVRRAGPPGGRRVRQRHPGVHRPRAVLAAPLRRGRPAGHRRRHQEPGRRDDHAPRAHPPVHGPRRAHRPHVPAELRWQHRLPEHARARAPRVQEDLEDQRGHLDDGLRPRRGRHPRRAVGLRAVAQGPQVVPHPDRGHDLR